MSPMPQERFNSLPMACWTHEIAIAGHVRRGQHALHIWLDMSCHDSRVSETQSLLGVNPSFRGPGMSTASVCNEPTCFMRLSRPGTVAWSSSLEYCSLEPGRLNPRKWPVHSEIEQLCHVLGTSWARGRPSDWLKMLLLLETLIWYPCLRVYVQIHVDLNFRFSEFLPDSSRWPRD